MLLPPIVLSVLWVVVALARPSADDARPLAPTTTAGRVALASLVLYAMLLVDMSLPVTVSVGAVMVALWAVARWGRGDRAVLLALPLVFGLWALLVPPFFE